jgi:hypothetical protein
MRVSKTVVEGADMVWINGCACCGHRDLSRWWVHPSEPAATSKWRRWNCGHLDFHCSAISWHDLHPLRRGPEEER